MNEYQIALIVGACIGALWLLAYLFCWACQWVWSWVDDSSAPKNNWLASKINISKYKYEVFNDHIKKQDRKEGDRSGDTRRLSKNKKDEGKSIHLNNIEYKCDFEIFGGIITVGFITSLIPIALLISLKLYPLTLSLLLLFFIAFVFRVARRNKKMFDAHANDKDAHKD